MAYNRKHLKSMPFSRITFTGDKHASVSWDELDNCVVIVDSRVKRKRGVIAFLDETDLPAKWKIILDPIHGSQLDADIAIRIGGYVQVVEEFIRVNLQKPEEIPIPVSDLGWKYDLIGRPFLRFGDNTYDVPDKSKRDLFEALVVGYDLFSGGSK